jgi:hypothetical protein
MFSAGIAAFVSGRSWIGIAIWALAALSAMLFFPLTRSIATVIPGCATVGDLARCLWAKHSKLITEDGASDAQIWEAIVSVLCETIGLNPSQVSPELSFMDIEGTL